MFLVLLVTSVTAGDTGATVLDVYCGASSSPPAGAYGSVTAARDAIRRQRQSDVGVTRTSDEITVRLSGRCAGPLVLDAGTLDSAVRWVGNGTGAAITGGLALPSAGFTAVRDVSALKSLPPRTAGGNDIQPTHPTPCIRDTVALPIFDSYCPHISLSFTPRLIQAPSGNSISQLSG